MRSSSRQQRAYTWKPAARGSYLERSLDELHDGVCCKDRVQRRGLVVLDSFGRTNVCSSTLLFYTFLADLCWACSCIVSGSVLRGALKFGPRTTCLGWKEKCCVREEMRPNT